MTAHVGWTELKKHADANCDARNKIIDIWMRIPLTIQNLASIIKNFQKESETVLICYRNDFFLKYKQTFVI